MTEDELLKGVLRLAGKYDVACYHCYDSRKTAGAGFPDLVLCGQENILFAELKNQGGSRKERQTWWFYRLTGAGGWYRLWRPSDYIAGTIENTLRDL